MSMVSKGVEAAASRDAVPAIPRQLQRRALVTSSIIERDGRVA
jgi:hypothetical protein